MFEKFLAKLRGSSREPEDLALGTKRPGDFVEPEEGEELIVPNPHDEDERKDDGVKDDDGRPRH